MRKFLLIAKTTWWRRVRTGNFLLLTFGLPALMVIAGAIPILREVRAELPSVGVVDMTGRLAEIRRVELEDDTLTIERYEDEGAARAALSAGLIGAYLLIPPGYFQSEQPILYSPDAPTETLKDALEHYLRRGSLPEAPDWLIDRIEDPARLRYEDIESGDSVQEGLGLIVWGGTPVLLAFIFALLVFTGSNQLGSAVVREKDQRAMEMVITSIRPRTLVAGKVLGMTLASLTQLGIWILGGAVAIGLAVAGRLAPSMITMRWGALIWALVLGIPGYFLYAFIGAGLGIIAGDQQQARQLSGILGMLGLSPLYLVGVLISAPDGTLAVALSLFPLTAPTFSLIRMTLTTVPTWQLALALGLILISLVASIWVVTRIFRAAMLLYGQRLRPKEIWRALRAPGQASVRGMHVGAN